MQKTRPIDALGIKVTARAAHLNGELSKVQGVFGIEGGTIGRGGDCSMVLPDPDRRVSRMQARLFHEGGQFFVANASALNPMYLNGIELAAGASTAVGHGDELRAGSYVMTLALAGAAQAGPQPAQAQPAAQARPAAPAQAGDPFADLMGAPVETHLARAQASELPRRGGMAYIPEDFNPLAAGGVSGRNAPDPIAALGLQGQGLDALMPERSIDSIYASGQEPPSALAGEALGIPGEGLLHAGQDADPLKLFGAAVPGLLDDLGEPAGERSARDHTPEVMAFFAPPKAQPEAGPWGDALGAPAGPRPSIEEATATRPAGAVPAPAAPGPAPASADGRCAAPAVEGAAWPGQARQAGALMDAFKRGAGLPDWAAAEMSPELAELAGRLLRIAVEGAVSLLAARAAIKQEIRLSATLLNPKANNPLKFLPEAQVALLQMLGPRMPGIMAAADAMQEAFDDLLTHQAALAAGTQATIDALFARFDPGIVQARAPARGLGERVSPTLRRARLWQRYVGEYQSIRNEVQDDFFKKLGSEFHAAYNREFGIEGGQR